MKSLILTTAFYFCAVLIGACAVGEDEQVSEVLSQTTCQATPCVGPLEVEERLGFRAIEPDYLPAGFSLHSREILPALPGSEADSTASPERVETTLLLDYRFLNSDHVPALHLFETIVIGESQVELTLLDASCGEVIDVEGVKVIYGLGEGSLIAGDNLAEWSVCAGAGPTATNAHVAYLTIGNIILEVKAFPEGGIDKNDLFEFIAALPLDVEQP